MNRRPTAQSSQSLRGTALPAGQMQTRSQRPRCRSPPQVAGPPRGGRALEMKWGLKAARWTTEQGQEARRASRDMYIYINVCMHVCMHACMYLSIYLSIYLNYLSMFVRTYVCMYVDVCVYVCVCMHVCMCTRIYALFTSTHTHMSLA